jgi:hypothetical protein
MLCIFEHSNQYIFQVLLQEIFRLLCSLMLPLYYLMPNGPTEFDNLNDEIENRLCFAGHHKRHCCQLILCLLLWYIEDEFGLLTFIFDHGGHSHKSLIKVDPNQGLQVSAGGYWGVIVLKDLEQIREILQFCNLLVEHANQDEYWLLDDRQRH